MSSPTQRSLEWCRKHGLDAGIVERFNAHSRTRHDLFGVIDLVVMEQGIVGVQATSGANVAARRSKILAEPRARIWLENGGRLECWGWRQLVKRTKSGGKVKRWELRRVPVTLEDFDAEKAEVERG